MTATSDSGSVAFTFVVVPVMSLIAAMWSQSMP